MRGLGLGGAFLTGVLDTPRLVVVIAIPTAKSVNSIFSDLAVVMQLKLSATLATRDR